MGCFRRAVLLLFFSILAFSDFVELMNFDSLETKKEGSDNDDGFLKVGDFNEITNSKN